MDIDGTEVAESYVGPGGSVGGLACYFGIRFMFSYRAWGPCMCLRLLRDQFMLILKAYADDEEVVAQNAMGEFNKARRALSSHGGSTAGKSVKSG